MSSRLRRARRTTRIPSVSNRSASLRNQRGPETWTVSFSSARTVILGRTSTQRPSLIYCIPTVWKTKPADAIGKFPHAPPYRKRRKTVNNVSHDHDIHAPTPPPLPTPPRAPRSRVRLCDHHSGHRHLQHVKLAFLSVQIFQNSLASPQAGLEPACTRTPRRGGRRLQRARQVPPVDGQDPHPDLKTVGGSSHTRSEGSVRRVSTTRRTDAHNSQPLQAHILRYCVQKNTRRESTRRYFPSTLLGSFPNINSDKLAGKQSPCTKADHFVTCAADSDNNNNENQIHSFADHEGRVLGSGAVFLPAGDDDVSLLVLFDRQAQLGAEEGQLNLGFPRTANRLRRVRPGVIASIFRRIMSSLPGEYGDGKTG